MTVLKLTSMAAALAIAVGAASATNTTTANGNAAAQTPEQRALALALSLADQAASQKPKTAVLADSSAQTAPAALAAGVSKATKGAK